MILFKLILFGIVLLIQGFISQFGLYNSAFIGAYSSGSIKNDHIIFVGDILLARDVEMKIKQYGTAYPFSNITEFLTAHVIVGNFEAAIPVLHKPTPHFNTQFSVNKELIPALRAAGFTHLSLANNHSYDFEAFGFDNTQATLRSAGIVAFGNPLHIDATSITYMNVDDVQVALIALSTIDTVIDIDSLLPVIQEAGRNSDMQIAYVHWGNEYELQNSDLQRNLAYDLADLGIDIIVGHHPHVVQNIEVYKNTPIFYSLGNFIFDQYFSKDVQNGLMLELSLQQPDTFSIRLIPVSSEYSHTSPQALASFEREEFLENLAKRSAEDIEEDIQSGMLSFELK
ncbi:MAG: CapA family protein [Candidatus Paceibacterota bacterium]